MFNSSFPRRAAATHPALLCVVPPYTVGPPAGIAYLLAYARSRGCSDFGFLDLRLGIPDAYAPTYTHTGAFGEAYVMDVPDLPLVLSLVAAFEEGRHPTSGLSLVLERYCRERRISAAYLADYLACLDRYFEAAAEAISGVRFIGFSVWTSNFLTTLFFAAHLKRLPQPPIIVGGGPQVTESFASAAIAVRSRLFDYVATGEGEATLFDLYSHVMKNGGAGGYPVPGTITIDATGTIQRGAERPLLPPAEIPVPVYDQMPLLTYQRSGFLRSVPYHLSRGCTDKCVFCSEWVFWRRFRPGGADSTLSGIRALQQSYRAEHIAFTDSLLNGHPGRLQAFAEGMLKRRPRLAWSGFMRAQMDAATAALLFRAGCDSVFVGIESMSDETLALMNKRRTEAENMTALRAFLGAGIHVVAGVIPGFPGDGRAAFTHTVEELRSLQREYRGRLRLNVEPFIVSPGQPLYSRLETMGLEGIRWDDAVLDIAPAYRDVTQKVFCEIRGANQGLERMGRLRIAEAVASDQLTQPDLFEYRAPEDVGRAEFVFDHLTNGWFLARLKAPSSWIHAMIVSDAERGDIEARVADTTGNDVFEDAGLRRLLGRIEKAHLLRPQREPRFIQGAYGRGAAVGPYCCSPYIIARQAGGAHRRVLVADFVNATFWSLARWEGEALRVMQTATQTPSSLQRRLAKAGISRSVGDCEVLLQFLKEEGLALCAPATGTS